MNSHVAAVIIPVYKPIESQDELLSFYNTLFSLENDIFIICPFRLKRYCEIISKNLFKNVYLKLFDDHYFDSITGYNKLMLNINFYKEFKNYKYILIAQLDTLIFGNTDSLKKFEDLGYSYIGAPWVLDNEEDEIINLQCLSGVGNGGLSLRNINDTIFLLSNYKFGFRSQGLLRKIVNDSGSIFVGILKYIIIIFGLAKKIPVMNEDKFICTYLAPCFFEKFKVSDLNTSLNFSIEKKPKILLQLNDQIIPFGCHGWVKYDEYFWLELFIDKTKKISYLKEKLGITCNDNEFYKIRCMNLLPTLVDLPHSRDDY